MRVAPWYSKVRSHSESAVHLYSWPPKKHASPRPAGLCSAAFGRFDEESAVLSLSHLSSVVAALSIMFWLGSPYWRVGHMSQWMWLSALPLCASKRLRVNIHWE